MTETAPVGIRVGTTLRHPRRAGIWYVVQLNPTTAMDRDTEALLEIPDSLLGEWEVVHQPPQPQPVQRYTLAESLALIEPNEKVVFTRGACDRLVCDTTKQTNKGPIVWRFEVAFGVLKTQPTEVVSRELAYQLDRALRKVREADHA